MSDLVKVINRTSLTNLIMDRDVYKYLKKKFNVFDVVENKNIIKDVHKNIHLWIKSTNIMKGADLVTDEEIEITDKNAEYIIPIVFYYNIGTNETTKEKVMYYTYDVLDTYKNKNGNYLLK